MVSSAGSLFLGEGGAGGAIVGWGSFGKKARIFGGNSPPSSMGTLGCPVRSLGGSHWDVCPTLSLSCLPLHPEAREAKGARA